jgi:ABC-type transport system substrate-binding protein
MLSAVAARGHLAPMVLVGAVIFSACAPAAPSTLGGSTAPPLAATAAPAARAPNAVVLADFAEPASLNPAISTESPRVSRLIFEGLILADPKTGVATAALAEKWEQSVDGLVYTFHLRPNLKWSDGQPLTADDARFTFDLIRDPNTASPFKSNFDLVTAIDVADPLTLRVSLKAPSCPFLLNSMTQGILPKHALANSPDLLKDDFNVNPTTGSGPFVFKDRQKGDRITLVANPNYWRGKPKFDQWIFKTVADATAKVLQAQFKKLGMDVQTGILELNAFNQKVRTQHDFDAVVAQPVRSIDPDQIPNWASTSYPNGQNFIGYSNPDVDQLLLQAATLPGCGQQERQQLYGHFQDILAQEQPVTQLYSRKTTLAISKRIQGFDPSPWASDEFGIHNWVVAPR